MTNPNYTVTEAVIYTLNTLPEGVKYTGGQLHDLILYTLRAHGSDKHPYDSTTLRMVRNYGKRYGIVCDHNGNKAKYYKVGAGADSKTGGAVTRHTEPTRPTEPKRPDTSQPVLFKTESDYTGGR